MKITTVSAGLSNPSSASRLTKSIQSKIQEIMPEPIINHYELKNYGHDVLDRMFSGFNSELLESMMKNIEQSNALVLTTPIFNTGPSGLFKSFLDILEPGKLTGMPVILAATGGTDRHSLSIDYNIRPIMSYLRMEAVPTAIYASSNDWAKSGEESLSNRIERAVSELSSRLNHLDKPERTQTLDEFDPINYLGGEGKSFADLLKGSNPYV